MNARVDFDTHGFVKRLEAAGWSVAHAEALADANGDNLLKTVAAHKDQRDIEHRLRAAVNEVEASSRPGLKKLRTVLKQLDLRPTLRILAIPTATMAILAALKLLG